MDKSQEPTDSDSASQNMVKEVSSLETLEIWYTKLPISTNKKLSLADDDADV